MESATASAVMDLGIKYHFEGGLFGTAETCWGPQPIVRNRFVCFVLKQQKMMERKTNAAKICRFGWCFLFCHGGLFAQVGPSSSQLGLNVCSSWRHLGVLWGDVGVLLFFETLEPASCVFQHRYLGDSFVQNCLQSQNGSDSLGFCEPNPNCMKLLKKS